MKYFNMTNAIVFLFMALSCTLAKSANYKVTIPLSDDEDGLMGYLVDYDSGAKLDSAVVQNSSLVFNGNTEEPVLVQLIIDGTRSGMFVLESGEITGDIRKRTFTGTGLNQTFLDYNNNLRELISQARKLSMDSNATPEAKAEIEANYYKIVNDTKAQNEGNPIGLYIFLDEAYQMDLSSFEKALAATPAYAKSKRVQRLHDALVKKSETSVGKKYKDFTIAQPNGVKASLSDYVGKGHYTLVDFWASWCGPCIRETEVLKKIYKEYNDKGLEIVGVAVWDEPQNTLKAIETHQLPWNQIIGAQSIPTDIYGISGIPCIILFDPNGNIVSRDKQDDELIADVKAAMEKLVE